MLEQRLAILLQGGVIDQDIYKNMLSVVHDLEDIWLIPVHHPQGEMALTHMAVALMRSRRGEEIAPLDGEILASIEQCEHYDQLTTILRALLKKFTVILHPNEEGYLLVNLYGLMFSLENHSLSDTP
ncbi:PRD domain-containing protein [Xenorhabdus sp. 42]|uniref:PRD domain-containing protein n=1 Tax=Xenorhabdus szentirmaii TaxID=290112 RepID=A0AAW3YRK7_9GAMM|nr:MULTISPECIES: PRD domain-containing protein [Xenorhabdus]MBD2780270.1 PRD domain-containing protein [Xenorhabdus sp. 38]MBD2790756.1 PRD domain-containing protein [Xenorhabdus sp. CUL]MBD2800127.1 PRD domain-containing protein [Xenorhabdus sp. M]MBD2820654.1 PRD domain-containing protein [Xenorhabdus sp. 42]MBD2824102.1 PRD domain-containing protein [Xenorhabdus sp. 5]